jgi:hypothetical protein
MDLVKKGTIMGIVYRVLGVSLCLFLSNHALAEVFIDKAQYNVVLTRDLSVDGGKICHDGNHIYYKSTKECIADGKMSLCNDRAIAPIHQVERIILADDIYVTQFYKVRLDYKRIEKTDQTTKRRVAYKKVQACKDRPRVTAENILQERWATQEEYPYLYALLKNEIYVINSPKGEVRSLKAVNLDRHDPSTLGVFSKINLRSPHCDSSPIFTEYVMKLGGEYSGNGWNKANMQHLQESSSQIKFKGPVRKVDDLESVLKSKIYCVKTVNI